MNPNADGTWPEGGDAPQPNIMLQEAEWLNENYLGYPLNFMHTLYYEAGLFPTVPEEGEGPEEGDSDPPAS